MLLDNRTTASAGAGAGESVGLFERAGWRVEQATGPHRVERVSLTRLIGYLTDKHHAYARRQIASIGASLAGLSAEQGEAHPELARVRRLFKSLRQELLFHMEKEEVSLFPHIIRTETSLGDAEPQAAPYFGSMRGPVRMLMHEHDDLCAMFDRIREATGDYTPPCGADANYSSLCRALRDLEADVLQLVHLEDSVLFPRALRMESGERQG